MIQKYKLYNNKIILEFDDDKHAYSINKETVYGVTSIVGVLDKPALMYWSVNMAIEYMQANLTPGKALDEIQIKELLDGAKSAHRIKKDKAGDIGTLAHNWLDKWLKSKINKTKPPKPPVNKETKNAIKGFFSWADKNKVVPIASEQKIYSKKFKYAGTYDLLAKVNGKKTVIDFKTGKRIYPETLLQASAYLQAVEEEFGEEVKGGVIILRLSKEDKEEKIDSFEARLMDRKEVDELIKVFTACLPIFDWRVATRKEEAKKKYGI